MQEPGHSGRGSGGNGTVVGGREVGLGLGLCGGFFELSQQIKPGLQFAAGFGMSTFGRSQNAAMIINMQLPGHGLG